MVRLPEPAGGQHAHREAPEGGRDRQVALGRLDGPIVLALPPELTGAFRASADHRVDLFGCHHIGEITQVGDRLAPHLAPERVVDELIAMLGQRIGVAALDRLDEARVHAAPALVQQARVRDLVRQRVLEGVLGVGKETRLVDELRRLQAREPAR